MSVWPAWEVREREGATSWFHVRLAFDDGAQVDALAVLCGEQVSIEDVRAEPALSLDDLTALADWIEGPLFEACGRVDAACATGEGGEAAEFLASSRARPAWPRGVEGRRRVALEYRAAQEAGVDPVLAVMCATGHSRRRSLRLIAQARDAGFLTPRHARP
ncbi:DUF6214 family protein [Streptomyces olivochromogenes]|uniref:DUF6214 family protein n=1 Tax=Streptomyces olivochromogenes TaxID=1963 RepID=UPI001F4554EB|nr:DUF6214 family protein [Streptomyces olivochromogenes]MCF3136292.1 hypothetical protein [Streptomyces olivochromogenes]